MSDPKYSTPVSARLQVARDSLARLKETRQIESMTSDESPVEQTINPDLAAVLDVLIEVVEELAAFKWTSGATR